MLYLLTPRDPTNPRWQYSKIVQAVQIFASSSEAARNMAAMHLSTGPDSEGTSAWRDSDLCEVSALDGLLQGVAVIGEYGLIMPKA